ncbi:GPW/gp25 family protein [Novosphingopyxis sp. YJ-S2-01]|uniref:GPW/gp25 family protein n=1 Tax=Novosphingopyxis sp. YJ-S2-01 TaxID=2794021 RepID=UPI0018DBCD88|nr:GPW/gp25 family protein [Novosphingopyxis sp. YJ-S2-01]MBH9537906.1 GPW/gp25 family protein [Novosphingopyxis sp. YJ-S2-01]
MTARLATISGMDRRNGRTIAGLAHVRQSIEDILSTPIGSRLCNRNYGSHLPDLVDAPLNDAGRQAIFAATALAIAAFYPALVLTAIAIEQPGPGTIAVQLTGHEAASAPSAETVTLSIPLTQKSS